MTPQEASGIALAIVLFTAAGHSLGWAVCSHIFKKRLVKQNNRWLITILAISVIPVTMHFGMQLYCGRIWAIFVGCVLGILVAFVSLSYTVFNL